ncbi:MAG: malate dehydrogenase [Ignavibacteriales bacterium CG12_big_fil_rev_8_21_14_0_65_30_8]|nr:MAG: malate dehydrogenase [Ignavibacteriales bacterium CG12_big_fil_rev_8_21_14_0_65_30_8]
MARKKFALIGGGQIGGVLAQIIASKQLGDVVMFDVVEDLPQGKTLDIAEASRISGFDAKITGTNDYKDIAGSDIVIVTAGIPRKPRMSRDDLLTTNANIMKSVAEGVKKYAPNSIVIIISNPLDAMVTLFQKVSGFPHNRVMGQAGMLDSSRFSSFIAWELGVSVKDINAMVLGGHGDTMVPLVRYANVNGVPVMEMLERKYKDKTKANEVMKAMVDRTKQAGGEVVKLLKTGSAFFSPAASAVAMAQSIILDEKRVIPTCSYLDGEYGVDGYYLGVPAILGENGVEKVIELSLDKDEQAALDNSINAVKNLTKEMESLGF